MKIYQTSEIKNILLIGGTRSGKTTLAESMLFEGGIITRRGTVDDKNTVSDFKEIELERQNSVVASVLHTFYNDKKINVIDAPGLDDFVGEAVGAMKVTDAALLVINAQNGVEVGTELIWRHTNKNLMPVVFVINQLDHEKANFEESIKRMRELFGEKVIVYQYPLNTGSAFNAVIDVLSMKMLKFTPNGKTQITELPESEKAKVEELRSKIIETAAESDEELMEKFFENGTLTEEELIKGVKLGVTKRDCYPVLCASAKLNFGVSDLLNFVTNYLPSPNEVPNHKTIEGVEIKCASSEMPSAFVFKTSIEQHLGQISYFKLYSGEITEGMDMINPRNSSKERLSQLFYIAGKNRTKVEKVSAGDIAVTIKLKDTYTCDTLNSMKNPNVEIPATVFPQPKHRTAVRAKTSTDEEKLNEILKRIHNEDPTVLFEQSIELKQTILQGQSELHLNVVKWIIENIDKLEIEYFSPRIPYRETITKPAKATYKHKKQSGGSGQFGEVYMMIEPLVEGRADQTEFPIRGREEIPLTWGGKLLYHNCIVGGSIDARFMPAILKGIMEKIEEGPLTGSYARDIIVSIYDGKMHPVDSNEISFKLAGRNAFREAFKNAGPKILEPIYDVEVICPEENMGNVMTDLQGRRAIIMGMDADGGYQKILAKVPLAEMNKYSTTLSSLTSGRATYGMKYADYQQVPMDVQEKLLKEYEASQKDEE